MRRRDACLDHSGATKQVGKEVRAMSKRRVMMLEIQVEHSVAQCMCGTRQNKQKQKGMHSFRREDAL